LAYHALCRLNAAVGTATREALLPLEGPLVQVGGWVGKKGGVGVLDG